AFHGKLRRVDDLRIVLGVLQDALVDQARRPDDDVGCGDGGRPALGEQVRRARPGSHEHHPPLRLAVFAGGAGCVADWGALRAAVTGWGSFVAGLGYFGGASNHGNVTLWWF